MLTRPGRLALALAACCVLASCSEQASSPDARPPLFPVESSYQLRFNDTLVGHALFVLHTGDAAAYRLEAFTVPAGDMAQDQAHEVLETSEGIADGKVVMPRRFAHSIVDGDAVEAVALAFDWTENVLWLSNGVQRRRIALLPDTHDHLSYLLVARELALAGEGTRMIQVAAADATEENRLAVDGSERVVLADGSEVDAIRIRRTMPVEEDRRTLWIAPDHSPLPLRIERVFEGNTIEMRLESLIRTSSDPH